MENHYEQIYLDRVMKSFKSHIEKYVAKGISLRPLKEMYEISQFYFTIGDLSYNVKKDIIYDLLENLKKISFKEKQRYGLNEYGNYFLFFLNPTSAFEDIKILRNEINLENEFDSSSTSLRGLVGLIEKFENENRIGVLAQLHNQIGTSILNQMKRGDAGDYRHIHILHQARENLERRFPYLN